MRRFVPAALLAALIAACGGRPTTVGQFQIVHPADSTTFKAGVVRMVGAKTPSGYALAHSQTDHATITVRVLQNHTGTASERWTTEESEHAGLVFCAQSLDDDYVAMVSPASAEFQLVAKVDGTEHVLARTAAAVTLGDWTTIDAACDGKTVTARLLRGDETIATLTASGTLPAGRWGPHVYATTAEFR